MILAQLLITLLRPPLMPKQTIQTSLLEAANKFATESYDQSTMRKVIINMVHFKQASEILIRELKLVAKDLE